ncbi:NAD-dependent epimerase/dehydratase family protein [bacterium]|nr:NAD-dependent epimerase/dehydratase family protein [candidate division CSSED10-310 bacterium]
MRILITGGAGFIGSHIVDAYLAMGHDVAVVDNLSSGFRSNVNSDARFYDSSIQDPALEEVFRDFRPQIINHHAAHINLRQSVEDPVHDAENNIIGTLNLLNLSRQFSVQKFIFASTGGAIYGEPEQIPANEKTLALPLSPYGASKLAIEHYVRIWQVITGMDYTIFRYPNVYGPRQNPKGEAGVIAIFCIQILQNEQPVIFGDGTKTRDYLYVDDVVRANISALSSGNGDTFNLGWGKEISDQTVFDTVSVALDYREKPIYSSPRLGEVNRIALDASRAQDVLNWKPETEFREGVKRAARFYGERAKNNSKA